MNQADMNPNNMNPNNMNPDSITPNDLYPGNANQQTTEAKKPLKKGVSGIGFRYAIFGAAIFLLQIDSATILQLYFPYYVINYGMLLNFLLIIVTMYVIGYPLVCLLCRKLPKQEIEKQNLGFGSFLQGAFVTAGIVLVGMIIGTVINFAISGLSGADNNALAQLMLESKPFMRILTVGILAPIFEELIFRKVLVDRMAKYGKLTAVLASGLMFGLYHGNFSQFFFAAGLGCFFAYIYLKTGHIRYSILYHMMVNLTTSVGTIAVLTKYYAALDQVGQDAVLSGEMGAVTAMLPATLLMFGWLGLLGIIGLVGVILLIIYFPTFKLPETQDAPTKGQSIKAVLTAPGMLAFYAVCAVMFLQNYMPS